MVHLAQKKVLRDYGFAESLRDGWLVCLFHILLFYEMAFVGKNGTRED